MEKANTISNSGVHIAGTAGTSWNTLNMYNTPELIDVIVTPTEIQLVYKKQLLITYGLTMPQPEVYKVVYSRQDGSEKIIAGHYIPANNESYEFD